MRLWQCTCTVVRHEHVYTCTYTCFINVCEYQLTSIYVVTICKLRNNMNVCTVLKSTFLSPTCNLVSVPPSLIHTSACDTVRANSLYLMTSDKGSTRGSISIGSGANRTASPWLMMELTAVTNQSTTRHSYNEVSESCKHTLKKHTWLKETALKWSYTDHGELFQDYFLLLCQLLWNTCIYIY